MEGSHKPDLASFRVAVLAADGTDEAQLSELARALQDAGASIDILTPQGALLAAARSENYDGLLLPAGPRGTARVCLDAVALELTKCMQEAEKPVAAIGHGPRILVAAGLVHGRTLASHPDVANAVRDGGGKWVESDAEIDSNWITGRGSPGSQAAFCHEMIGLFSRSTPPVIQIAESA